MPQNKLIYFGLLIIVATAAIYVGGKLISQIEWFLPYAAGVGLLVVAAGIVQEAKKKQAPKPDAPPSEPNQSSEAG